MFRENLTRVSHQNLTFVFTAAVRCPEASSSPRAEVALNSGRRSAPSASLLDKAVGSNVPAETLREHGSRQQRPVLAYSSQVRRTFLHTYMIPTPHLSTCVPYTYYTYYTYTLYWQKERALDFELFSYNVIILMYMQSHNLYAVDKYSFSATHLISTNKENLIIQSKITLINFSFKRRILLRWMLIYK